MEITHRTGRDNAAAFLETSLVKKSFPLDDPKHKPARVVEAIKADIRKYLKRERRKPLPEGVDFWDFDCQAGRAANSAVALHVSEILKPVDTASREGWDSVYIEILAKPGHRIKESEPGNDR